MLIRELALKNVGRYADVSVRFGSPVAVILGVNGVGKTTLARAIEAILTGDVHAFRGTKVGLAGLIGPLGDAAVIQATIARGEPKDVEIRRRIGARGLTTSIGSKEATKAVFDYFAPAAMIDPAATFRVITNVSGFLDLPEAEQKALLLALVDRSVPKEALDGLPLEGRIDPPKTLDDLADAYHRVYESRRDTKRALDAIRVPPEPDMAEQDTNAIRDKIEMLRAQEKALIAQQGQATGQRQALIAQRDDLAEKVETAVGRLVWLAVVRRRTVLAERHRAADRVDQLAVRLVELGTIEDAQARLAEAKETLRTIQAENAGLSSGAQAERRSKQGRLTLVHGWDTALAKLGGACVIAEDVPCPLNDKKRADIRARWAKEIQALEAELAVPAPEAKSTARAEQRIREAEQVIAAIEQATKDRATAQTTLAEAEAAVTALPPVAPTNVVPRGDESDGGPPAKVLAMIERLTEQQAKDEGSLADVKRRLAALPDAPDTSATLAELRQRISAGETNVTKAQQVNDAWRARKRAQAQREVLEADVAALETLVAAFGPKGIGEKLLAERIGDVLAKLNRVLARFNIVMAAQTEPFGLRFNTRPPVLLSGSERFRVGVALQVAIGAITGARWALIDGADVLDKANRGILFALLRDAVERGFIEQAIVTATVANDDAFAIRWPAPFAAYQVSATEAGSTIEALAEAVPA